MAQQLERIPLQRLEKEIFLIRGEKVMLTREEIAGISQFVTSSKLKFSKRVTAFTEQRAAMLSSVLRSNRAISVNVEIMRTFVRLRQIITSNAELARESQP